MEKCASQTRPNGNLSLTRGCSNFIINWNDARWRHQRNMHNNSCVGSANHGVSDIMRVTWSSMCDLIAICGMVCNCTLCVCYWLLLTLGVRRVNNLQLCNCRRGHWVGILGLRQICANIPFFVPWDDFVRTCPKLLLYKVVIVKWWVWRKVNSKLI